MTCNICGSPRLTAYRRRADGVVVMKCSSCDMGVVERIPERLNELYEGGYYESADGGAIGYSDYSFMAEHSTAWAAPLVRLLCPSGRVLDIGCADGRLLRKLAGTHRCSGIELNATMAEKCAAAGIEVIGRDIFEPGLADRHRGSFDVVLAIAVFEHVADFRKAAGIALDLAGPDGVLVFETPLISAEGDNTAWFTSSLEHVYYPSEAALRRLFEGELGAGLAGSEIAIAGYASTFIGMASRNPQRASALGPMYRRLALGPIEELNGSEERLFRLLLDVVHAGKTNPGHLALADGLPWGEVNPELLRRMVELWKRDQKRLEASSSALESVEEARDWHAAEARRRGDRIVELEIAAERQRRQQRAVEERAAALGRELEGLRREPGVLARAGRTARGAARTLMLLASPRGWGGRLRNLGLLWKARRSPEGRRILRSFFNRSYYLRRCPDVAASGVAAFWHYLLEGHREGRRPSALFDPGDYGARHPGLAERGINPLLQYAVHGPLEGRTPLVSVIIPSFNYGDYVEQAVDSALRQTLSRLEVIVVEGGSTHASSVEKVRGLERRNLPRARFLYQDGRRPVGENRNFGIRAARGQWVCCLDADDLLKPVYLETAVFLAQGFGYDVVYPSLECFGQSNFRWILPDASFPAIAAENQISTVALFRRQAWEQVGGFRDFGAGAEYVPEDWEFFVRLLGHGFRAKSICEPLMRYRVHERGLMGSCQSDKVYQRQAIETANAGLLAGPPPAAVAALGPIDPGFHLHALPQDDIPGLLLALPFVTVGGAEKLLRGLTRALRDRGLRVVVITTLALPETVRDDSGSFEQITPWVYRLPFLLKDQEQRWAAFLRYLIGRYDIRTVLIAGCEFLYGMLPELAEDFPDLRVVDQLFNDEAHLPNNRRYAAYIDATIVPSASLAETLVRGHGERPERVVVIPHAIDPAPALAEEPGGAGSPAGLGLPPAGQGKLLVSFFGRHSEEKAPDVFVRIAARLRDHPGLYFCMTGEGPLRGAVLGLIEELGLGERVWAPGIIDQHLRLMQWSDVIVVPSRQDGMPLVVLEAQALGKPVVASAVGSIPEMLGGGESGFLCPPGDVEAFCGRILELCGSPEKRRAMGEAGREGVRRRHDAESMTRAYVNVLRGSG